MNNSPNKVKTIEIAIAAPELFTKKLIKVEIDAKAQSPRIAIPVNFISSTKSFDFIEVLENNINTINPAITEQIIKRIAKTKFQINFEITISSLLIPLDAIFLIVPVLKSFPTNIQGIIKNTKVTGLAIDLYCANGRFDIPKLDAKFIITNKPIVFIAIATNIQIHQNLVFCNLYLS